MTEREAEIVAAVRRAMNDFGIRRFTVTDVARAAGVSRQTVYERFGNREALVAAALEEGARDLVSRSAAAGASAEGAERLERAFATTLGFFARSPLWSSPDKRAELAPFVTVDGAVFHRASRETMVAFLADWYPAAADEIVAASADAATRTLVSHGLNSDRGITTIAKGLARTLHAALTAS